MSQAGPVEELRLDTGQMAAIVAHLVEVYPAEGCGLLAVPADGARVVRLYPVSNIADEPRRHYLGEPLELLEALLDIEQQGWRLGAIYHSHPHGAAWPSSEDVRQAYYPSALALIVSLARPEAPEARAFAIRDGAIEERRLLIEDDPAGEG